MRVRQSNRRYTENVLINFAMQGGVTSHIHVTFGFDDDERFVREVFCADFKAGSDYHLLAVDACILISRLLQHGESASSLFESVGRPLSLVGALLEAAATREKVIQLEGL